MGPGFRRDAGLGQAAEQDIEGAGAAMLRPGRGDRQYVAAHLGLVKPARHRALQDAAADPAMAGDNQHTAPARRARSGDKTEQRVMRLGLSHAVQIEARLDRAAAAFQPLGGGAIDAGELVERRLWWWWWWCERCRCFP